MSGPIRRVLALCVAAAVVGCSGAEETKDDLGSTSPDTVVATRKVSEMDPEQYIPPDRATIGITPAIRDTLRRLKKHHRINRDEAWKGEGGVLANDYMEVWYPEGRTAVTHAMRVFNVVMPALYKFKAYYGRTPDERLVINCAPHLKAYKQQTGREWWYYSHISGDTLTFQPIFVLVKRQIDGVAMTHEYFQWAIQKLSRYGAPRWLEEGFASYFSGEEDILVAQMLEFPDATQEMTPRRIEAILDTEETRKESRIAYYRSYRMVTKIVDTYGDDRLKKAVNLLGQGHRLDDAFKGAFGVGYDEVVRVATDYSIELPYPDKKSNKP